MPPVRDSKGRFQRWDPNAISVPESFARAMVAWRDKSFVETRDQARINLNGRMMNRQTGRTLDDVEQNSRTTPFGFILATKRPSLIAWMLGSKRKAYTVVPKRAKVLSWFKLGVGRIFARRVNIPEWTFTPVRPVLQDAVDRKKDFMVRLFEKQITEAFKQAFPDTRIEWKVNWK